MIHIKCNSSNINEFWYDDKNTLVVKFHSNNIYLYKNISLSLVEDWIKSESKGKFHYRFIRNKPNTKLTDEQFEIWIKKLIP